MALIKVKAKNLEVGDVFVGLESIYREPLNGEVLEIKEDPVNYTDLHLVIKVNSNYIREDCVNKNSKAQISTLRK